MQGGGRRENKVAGMSIQEVLLPTWSWVGHREANVPLTELTRILSRPVNFTPLQILSNPFKSFKLDHCYSEVALHCIY